MEKLPAVTGALLHATDSLRLSCRVECFPLCQIEWFHNGKALRNSTIYTINNNYLPADVKVNLQSYIFGVVYIMPIIHVLLHNNSLINISLLSQLYRLTWTFLKKPDWNLRTLRVSQLTMQ